MTQQGQQVTKIRHPNPYTQIMMTQMSVRAVIEILCCMFKRRYS